MTTAFYSHTDCRAHDMGRGHPECPQRLDAIHDHLIATKLASALDLRDAPLATPAQIERAHSTRFVTGLQASADTGGVLVRLHPAPATGAGHGACVLS